MRRIALFIALMSTALALGPALAHLLELPNKIALPRNAYFTVQQIYAGWSLLGVVLLVQLVSIASVIAFADEERRLRLCAIVALLCLVGAQALFWTFTYPANAATANWTVQPDNGRRCGSNGNTRTLAVRCFSSSRWRASSSARSGERGRASAEETAARGEPV